MELIFRISDGAIRYATDGPIPDLDEGEAQVTIEGSAEQDANGDWLYPWPHPNGPSACMWDGLAIVANPAVPDPGSVGERRAAIAKRMNTDPVLSLLLDVMDERLGQSGSGKTLADMLLKVT